MHANHIASMHYYLIQPLRDFHRTDTMINYYMFQFGLNKNVFKFCLIKIINDYLLVEKETTGSGFDSLLTLIDFKSQTIIEFSTRKRSNPPAN